MHSPTPDQIRAAREAAGLTQDAAATLISCSRRAWIKWERGERQMHPAMWELFQVKTEHLPTPPLPPMPKPSSDTLIFRRPFPKW